MVGVKTQDNVLNGVSQFQMLTTGNPARSELFVGYHAAAFTSKTKRKSLVAIRQHEWKLVHNFRTEENFLYNLKNDRSEKNNLAKRYPAKVKLLLSELQGYIKKNENPMANRDSTCGEVEQITTPWGKPAAYPWCDITE